MFYLLDTNVVSELRKDPKKMDTKFRKWAESVDLNLCFLSVLSILELEQGILAKERLDHAQGEILRTWLKDYVLRVFKNRLLTIDLPVALLAASYHCPDPAPYYDALIAASASINSYTVATRNISHFDRFGVASVNPWE